MPEIKESRWELENFQRNAIIRGLKKCKPDDIILISDVDEIPCPKKITEIKNNMKTTNKIIKKILEISKSIYLKIKNNKILSLPFKIILSYPIILFKNKNYAYYLNGFVDDRWIGTAAVRYDDLVNIYGEKPQMIRDIRSRFFVFLNMVDGGWHFSYLGGPERIQYKLKSFAHAEYDTTETTKLDNINKLINEAKTIDNKKIHFVKIDESFPNT